MKRTLRNQRIRTRARKAYGETEVLIGGWLSGKDSYLWLGKPSGGCLGFIGGQPLYRLAKAIVKRYEAQK